MFNEIPKEIRDLKPSAPRLVSEFDESKAGVIDPEKLKNNKVMQVVHDIIVERKKKEGDK